MDPLASLRERLEEALEEPRNQILAFTWIWRLGLVMALLGYAIIAYLAIQGKF